MEREKMESLFVKVLDKIYGHGLPKEEVEIEEEIAKLAQATLENGMVVEYESLEPGAAIFLIEGDERVPLPNGEYVIEEKVIIVEGGFIVGGVAEEALEKEPEVKAEKEETKLKTDMEIDKIHLAAEQEKTFSAVYDQKIKNAEDKLKQDYEVKLSAEKEKIKTEKDKLEKEFEVKLTAEKVKLEKEFEVKLTAEKEKIKVALEDLTKEVKAQAIVQGPIEQKEDQTEKAWEDMSVLEKVLLKDEYDKLNRT